MPPVNGQKLSQTVQVQEAQQGDFVPLFQPNVSNTRIKFEDLIIQIRALIDAYTKSETDLLLDAKANDSDVVHKTGIEAIFDEKQFQSFPILPAVSPLQDFQAVHKKYVDDIAQFLADNFNALSNLVNNRWVVPELIDCSTNQNYPNALKGQTFLVQSGGAGKIGGAQGKLVEEGDVVLCIQANTGGSQQLVGYMFTILQGNIDKATDEIAGTIKLSTNNSVLAGLANDEAVTPATLEHKINQQLLRKSALKTLRFYFGTSPPPGLLTSYTVVPVSGLLTHVSLVAVAIYGMCFLDNSPFDNALSNPHNPSAGTLDLTSFADPGTGEMFEGQKLVLTVIKI